MMTLPREKDGVGTLNPDRNSAKSAACSLCNAAFLFARVPTLASMGAAGRRKAGRLLFPVLRTRGALLTILNGAQGLNP